MVSLLIVVAFFVFSLVVFLIIGAAIVSGGAEITPMPSPELSEAKKELEEYLRLLCLDDISLGIAKPPKQMKSLYETLIDCQASAIIQTGPLRQSDIESIKKAWREKQASPPLVPPPRPRYEYGRKVEYGSGRYIKTNRLPEAKFYNENDIKIDPCWDCFEELTYDEYKNRTIGTGPN